MNVGLNEIKNKNVIEINIEHFQRFITNFNYYTNL